MILGMSIQTFTLVHTAISLIAILTGLIVMVGMLTGKRMPEWTGVFLLTTVLTSVTGFMFPVPISLLLPSQITGIVALAVLLPTLAAIYVFKLSGPWRLVYIIGAVISLYLNVFVLVAQAFFKVPAHQRPGADASRASLRDRARVGVDPFCRAGDRRGDEVPSGSRLERMRLRR